MEWKSPTRSGRNETNSSRWTRALFLLAAGCALLAAALSSLAQEPVYRPGRAAVQMDSTPQSHFGPGQGVPGRPPARAAAVIESPSQPEFVPPPLPEGHDASRATVSFEPETPADVLPPPTPANVVETPVRVEFPTNARPATPPPPSVQDPAKTTSAPPKPAEARPTMRMTIIQETPKNTEPVPAPTSPTIVQEPPLKSDPPPVQKPEAQAPKRPALVQEPPVKRASAPPAKPEMPRANQPAAEETPVQATQPFVTKPDRAPAPSATVVKQPPVKQEITSRSPATKPDESKASAPTVVQQAPVKQESTPAKKLETRQATRPAVVQKPPAKAEPTSAPKSDVVQTPAPAVVQEPLRRELQPPVRAAASEGTALPTEAAPTPKTEVQSSVRAALYEKATAKPDIPSVSKRNGQSSVRTAAFQEPGKTEIMPAPRSAPRPLQTPSVIDPFNPTRIRLPRLGYDGGAGRPRQHGEPTPSGPQLSKEEMEEYGQFVQEMVDPRSTLDLIIGRPRLMILKEVPVKVQIGDEEIAGYQFLGPRQISLLARRTGTTVLNMWFTDPKDKTKERILSYLVRVLPDPDAKARLEQIYKALADEINEAFPDSLISLTLVGDKLVVSGQAKDIAEATQILRIVRSQAPQEETTQIPFQNVQVAFAPEDVRDMRDFFLAGGPNVINLIRVPGEQQVMLRVTVAEVNRAAARTIGLNFTIANNNGLSVFSQLTGGLVGVSELNNLPVALDNGQINLAVNALRRLDYAHSLAEPVLTTMNGQTATFHSGGQFPVPVVTGFTGAGLQGVSFIPFGVLLNFTPYITDKDRIRLNIAAEVSTRDLESGTNINNGMVAGLNTRNFQTTVELREGQTLCVAGLLQNNDGAKSSRVPLFGDLPVLGRLASFDRLTSGEQELVILITPELVHPLEPDELLPLPGSDVVEPGDLEFYLLGRIESRREYDYRATVRTDIHRMLRYRHCEDAYIYGPKGYSNGPVYNLADLHGYGLNPTPGYAPPLPGHRPEPKVQK